MPVIATKRQRAAPPYLAVYSCMWCISRPLVLPPGGNATSGTLRSSSLHQRHPCGIFAAPWRAGNCQCN